MTIADMLIFLEQLAPKGLACSWDNVGLQVGSPDWAADRVLLTLDVTAAVIDYARNKGFDLILSHHPLIFKPVHSVSRPDILRLVEYRIGVIALHTNLDVVPDGVNYALAEVLGLTKLRVLSPETGSVWYHGSVTVPPDYVDRVRIALHNAGAGRIGAYDRCSTAHPVSGTFRALPESQPFLGNKGSLEQVEEVELEFMVDGFHLAAVKQALAAVHPYETPAAYFVAVETANPAYGLGLIGELAAETTLEDFARQVKQRLQAPGVQLWTAGKPRKQLVRQIAICGGAGGSLIGQATGRADVFVTGDLNYHAMLDSRIPLINAGHFWTEYPVLPALKRILAASEAKVAVFPLSLAAVNQIHYY